MNWILLRSIKMTENSFIHVKDHEVRLNLLVVLSYLKYTFINCKKEEENE